MNTPSLYGVHRWLIRVFIVASLAFGIATLRNYLKGGETTLLFCSIGAFVVAVASFAYLLTAPYLRKK